MGITANRAYNDPNLGAAFGSLAQAFMPPSGSDLSGYATAAATRDQASRLAQLFAMSQDPNVDLSALDRGAGIAGSYNPTQSWTAQSQNDATVRRAQDVSAQSALDVAGLDNTARQALQDNKPVILGQGETAYLSDQMTKATGLPGMFSGAMNVGPGETMQIPGQAQPLRGQPTVDTVKAGVLSILPPEMQAAITAGMTGVSQVVNPDGTGAVNTTEYGALGKTPAPTGTPVQTTDANGGGVYADPTTAAILGLPVHDPKAGAVDVKNYKTPGPDGKVGTAKITSDGTITDAATGEVLPKGTLVFTGALTGDAAGTGLGKSTEKEQQTAYGAEMADAPTQDILNAFDTGALPTGADYQMFSAMRTLPAAAAPLLVKGMSQPGQIFYQNLRSALPYQLMVQSGLATTEAEYERKLFELIPIPGEDTAVTSLKRRQFATFVRVARASAGPAYDNLKANEERHSGKTGSTGQPGADQTGPDQTGTGQAAPPQEAIDYLKANPGMKDAFELKYGPGSAAAAGVN